MTYRDPQSTVVVTGVVVEVECPQCDNGKQRNFESWGLPCPMCNGTGEARLTMSIHGFVEMMKAILIDRSG